MESIAKTIGGSRRAWFSIQLAAGTALSLLLGWIVVRRLDWAELATNLKGFPLYLFILALAVYVLGMFFRAWRWRVLFVRERISFLRLFLIQNAGLGLNNVSPVRIVSDPVQLALTSRREGVPVATGLATLVMEHLVDLFVSAAALGLGVLLLQELKGFNIQVAAALVYAVVSLLVLLFIANRITTIPGLGRIAFFTRAVRAIKTVGQSPVRLLLSLLGTLGYWTLFGVSGWTIAQGLDINIGVPIMVVLFMGIVFFVSVLPSLPGGAISFEVAVVYSLGLFGIREEPALVFAILMHVITYVPSTVIAAMVLPREGIKMFGRRDPTKVVDRDGRPVA